MDQYRQGDVLIERVDAIPAEAVRVAGEIILAHGEATGHAHRVTGRTAKLFEKHGERFLKLDYKARVVHQEHAAIALDPGVYRVSRQREYFPEAVRNVAD